MSRGSASAASPRNLAGSNVIGFLYVVGSWVICLMNLSAWTYTEGMWSGPDVGYDQRALGYEVTLVNGVFCDPMRNT